MCFGVFPYIMHTIPKSPYLKIFCNIPQNITWNVFQSISKTISLNIVVKFGENFCNSIVSDYMAINEKITHIPQVKTCKNVKVTHFMITNDTPHYIKS